MNKQFFKYNIIHLELGIYLIAITGSIEDINNWELISNYIRDVINIDNFKPEGEVIISDSVKTALYTFSYN